MRPPQARIVLALLALITAACDRRAEPEAAPPPADPAPPAAAEPEIRPGLSWASQVTGAGVSLLLFDAAGGELLHLACVRDRAVMTVEVEPFEAIGSEERLSLGVDGEAFVFVADPSAERASGVQAEAPIDAELLRRLEGATGVSASYGAETLGPHMPPDPESAERFISACRRITAP